MIIIINIIMIMLRLSLCRNWYGIWYLHWFWKWHWIWFWYSI